MNTIEPTEISFDPAKNAANVQKRGLPFSLVKSDFNWATALVVEFTPRANAIHVISLRKANRREETEYAAQT